MEIELPKIGQVWRRGKFKREVVEIEKRSARQKEIKYER